MPCHKYEENDGHFVVHLPGRSDKEKKLRPLTKVVVKITLLGKGDLVISIAEWLYYNSFAGIEIERVVPVVPEPEWCPS